MTTSKVREGEGPDYGPGPTSKGGDVETADSPESIAQQPSGVNGDADKYVANIPYLANIPQEMRELTQWVTWKLITRDGKSTKVLYNARTGRNASVTDKSTWSMFEQASKAYDKGKYSGIGFVLTPEFGCVCIDLDHCRDARSGEIELREQEIIDGFATYTEISQSGTGIHIFVKAHKPGEKCRKGNVEIYNDVRYIAMTGNVLEGKPTTIENQQEALDALYQDTFGKDGTTKATAKTVIEDDLVLDPDASPPSAKFTRLLGKRNFRPTWMKKRDDLPSASEYEASLACLAADAGWSDQEIADLIIAWSRENREDMKKVLRPDYIKRTIEGARGLRGSEILSILPFKVAKVVQYGRENPKFELVLGDGKTILAEDASILLNGKKMREALVAVDYFLPDSVVRQWHEIVRAILDLKVVEEIGSERDETLRWLLDTVIVIGRCVLLDPDTQGCPKSLPDALSYSRKPIIIDRNGRVYFRLADVEHEIRQWLGPSTKDRTVATKLRMLGFETKDGVRLRRANDPYDDDKVGQTTVWLSPAGMVPQETVDAVVEGWEEKAADQVEKIARYESLGLGA